MVAPLYDACIFDLDGVIINSEPIHEKAMSMAMQEFGIPRPPDLFPAFKGRAGAELYSYVATVLAHGAITATELSQYKNNLFREMFGEITLIDGFEAFVAVARQTFPKLGVATSSVLTTYRLAADRFRLDRWFDVALTCEDTPRHKPDPAPYLQTAAALGVSPARAFVIEDSDNGIKSAKAAGCTAFGITTTFPRSALQAAGADHIVDTYGELTIHLGLHPLDKM